MRRTPGHSVEQAHAKRPSVRLNPGYSRSDCGDWIDRRTIAAAAREIGGNAVRAIQHQACNVDRIELAVEVDEPAAQRNGTLIVAPKLRDIGLEQPRNRRSLDIICRLDVPHPPRQRLTVEANDLRMEVPASKPELVATHGHRDLELVEQCGARLNAYRDREHVEGFTSSDRNRREFVRFSSERR